MKSKFLKMTFMALCLNTSSVVHAMHEDGDEEAAHAPVPVLFSGEYEISGAKFLEPEYGSVTVYQFNKSILALQVNLNDSPGLWNSQDPKVLQPLLKLSESNSLDNLVALYYNANSTPEETRYYGEKTVENFNMTFDFRISDTPVRGPGEKGFQLLVQFVPPVVSKTVVIPATEINSWKETEINFGEDPVKGMPTIHFSLFKKADEQSTAHSLWSSSSTPEKVPAVPALQQLSIPEFHMGKISPFPISGFSHPAHSHIWTEGEIAEITIPVAKMEPRPSSISFLNTGAFVTPHHEQELIVEVNGQEIRRHFYSVGNNNQIIEIPLPQVDLATIEFKILNAISPLDLGISADKRKLGISFGEVHFSF
jgi:hypothetical protein